MVLFIKVDAFIVFWKSSFKNIEKTNYTNLKKAPGYLTPSNLFESFY